ncbi:hypothetical protein [Catenulispora yoronensis]|uniref:hypothetical protein n=1 Tax=Catenulispora yoronensis TaxID=450799 RepID=UPI0031DCB840
MSGAIVVLAGLLIPYEILRDRICAAIGGAGLIGYGVYVAHQGTATYHYPAVVLAVPVVAILYLVGAAIQRGSHSG